MATEITFSNARRDLAAVYRLSSHTLTLPLVGWNSRGRAIVVTERGRLAEAARVRPSSAAGTLHFEGVFAGREPFTESVAT